MDTKINVTTDNFSTICRICLNTTNLLPFVSLDILKIFKDITNIEVKEADQFPNNICTMCAQRLRDIGSFIEQCLTNHSILGAALEQNNKVPIDISSGFDIFAEEDHLIKHEISANEIKNIIKEKNTESFDCAICSMRFLRKNFLINHMSIHEESLEADILPHKNSTQKYNCEICEKVFHTNFALVKHKKLHIKKKKRTQPKYSTFNCSRCSRILTSQSSLDNHMKTHTGDRPYKCSYCEKDFPYINSLTVHTRLHTGETPYICSFCNKGYHSSTSLKKHKENKHVIEQYCVIEESQKDSMTEELNKIECPICNKFLSKHGYGTHIRTHTNEKKRFNCTFCHKVFQKISHLERHVRIHTGERPYACNICNKSFTQDGDLKRHVAIHSGQKEFQCQHCGKQFFSKSSLYSHILHHKESLKSDHSTRKTPLSKPDESPNSKSDCISIRQKPFLCIICGKAFTANSSLKVHHRLHTGENPFNCDVCNKSYNNSSALKGHIMRHHTGEKPHGCIICHKRFHDSTNLKRHINRVHSVLDFKNQNKSNETISNDMIG